MRGTLEVNLLRCALGARASAQVGGDKGGVPGVEVVGFEWKYDGYAPVEVVQSGKSGVTLSVNGTTRYVFKDLKRSRLQSKQQVAPGATLSLSKEVLIGPDENTRHLTAGKQRVRLTRVE